MVTVTKKVAQLMALLSVIMTVTNRIVYDSVSFTCFEHFSIKNAGDRKKGSSAYGIVNDHNASYSIPNYSCLSIGIGYGTTADDNVK